MADTNKTQTNQTMQREQAKASVAGGERKPEHKSDEDRREQARLDKERAEQGRDKSAIGGGENRGQTSQNREFDKSRSEPAGR